jgi:hypothetical protein
MLWGCFSAARTENLFFIEGTINCEKYQQILRDNLLASAKKLEMGRSIKYQQDNKLIHKAIAKMELFQKKKVKVLGWPSQSSNLILIENLLNYLKLCVQKRSPRDTREMV